MENAMILLYDICRLCLDEPGVDNIYNPVDWSQDIFTYTGVKVNSSDKLPQTICSSCRDIMTCAKVLKEVATSNDKRLQIIRGRKNENDDEQVLITESASHLVIISPCTKTNSCMTSFSNQNESDAPPEITSSTVKKSLKSRLVYESDDKDQPKNKTEKHNKKKRKSSSQPENTSSSSTKKIDSPSMEAEKNEKGDDKEVCSSKTVSSSTKKSQPSATSSNKVSGTTVKSEFQYECKTCNKTYCTAKKLYLHQLAHNKKFICPIDVCEKKFATKGDLKKHIRSHTGEKPFKCNLCEQSFSQNVSLKSHKENVHNETRSQR